MIKRIITTLVATLVITATVAGMVSYVRYENTSYKNAIRYAEEHNIKCYAHGPNIAYVFSDGSIIGRDIMYKMYK